MTKYFDINNNRLVYTGKTSNIGYWDSHWDKNNIEKLYPKYKSPFDYVINTSKKHLKPSSLVLEGGCGTGQQVFKLHNEGYRVVGVDYAERTVKKVNIAKPELDIRLGDVRSLDFTDNYFDAYWSFGVIEHFYNGYEEVLKEMNRVLKPKGYIFITFPHMSLLRRWKALKNRFPRWKNNKKDIINFYQFALDENTVISDFERLNFKLIDKKYQSGIKGLKDEVKFLKKPLQKIYDSRNIFLLIVSKLISILFGRFSSHSILLIFKKQ